MGLQLKFKREFFGISTLKELLVVLLAVFSIGSVLADGAAGTIQNKRVALFYDKEFPWENNPRSLEWYQETLAGMGLDVRVVNAMELCDEKLMTRRNFDTIFLPDGSCYPMKAEYTLTAFLAEGGSIVAGELQKSVKSYDEQNASWNKTHGSGWFWPMFTEWQLYRAQFLGEKGKRSLNVQLSRNAQLPEDIQSRLPANAGPFANSWYYYLETASINVFSSGGKKTEGSVAGNILWPVYTLPSGEKTDFVGYRHHNIMLNGSTLALLGETGRALLKTDAAKDVLYAAFKMCELPFPGEQSAEYYQRLFEAQKGVSRLSGQYVETESTLSDAAMAAFYQGKTGRYAELKDQLSKIDKDFFAVMDDDNKANVLLYEGKEPEKQDVIRKEIMARTLQLEKEFAALKGNVQKETEAIRRPRKVAVKNKLLDRLQFEAGDYLMPCGEYMLRRHFFQTLKQLGVNVMQAHYTGNRITEYLKDPQIKKNSEGIKFTASLRGGGGYSKTYSIFDKTTGTVKEFDTKSREEPYDKPLDNEIFTKRFSEYVSIWKDLPVYRFYISDTIMGEGNLAHFYWGEQARKDYQAYLGKKHSTIQGLNKRWNSQYQSFAEITVPVKQPETETEHANWEDWSVFRDNIYYLKTKGVHELSKQYFPGIPVSYVMSTLSLGEPTWGGTNAYRYTSNQDISGMDGTALVDTMGEWTWQDLNRGIPHHTVEWGPYYNPPANPRQWKNSFAEDWWALFTGGSVGTNLYFWSWGGSSTGSVDVVGLPTLTGWHTKRLIDDANRFGHILLDGKRPADTRILYSDSCRRHDQSWSDKKSRHLLVVNDLYKMFTKWQWPAVRVLAEEALNEGKDISECRLMLVPQAEYLSESTQTQLLDYARNGGNVLIEGYSGKLDNYAHESGKLFSAGKVKCLPSSSDAILVGNEEIPILSKECVYRMEAEKGAEAKVLIRYADNSPAMVSCKLGKGKLIFCGIPFGLLNMTDDGRRIMGVVNKELGLAPKCEGNDRKLVVREWEYDGKTWLLCWYPKSAGPFKECVLKIQGAYKVNDYLLGMEVPVQTDKKETMLRFTMPAPGMRVFRLDPLGAKELAGVKMPNPSDMSLGRADEDNEEQLHMPYKGFIMQGRPVDVGGYKIEVVVIQKGEADLVVGKGAEKVTKRITADPAFQFGTLENARKFAMTVGGNILTIYSKAISDQLPIGVDIEITEAKQSLCSFRQTDGLLTLQNGMIRLEVNANLGGRVSALVTEKDGINHVASDKGPKTGINESTAGIPGPFAGQPFVCDVETDNPDAIAIKLKSRDIVNGMRTVKRFKMKKGEAAFTESVEVAVDGKTEQDIKLRLQAILGVGGTADYCDSMYVPAEGGVKDISYSTRGTGKFVTPAGDWAGIIDRKQKTALIERFSPKEIKSVMMWQAGDFYTLELFKDLQPVTLKPGQTDKINVRFMMIPGMSALDMVTKNMAAALNMAPGLVSGQDVPVKVEVGSSLAAERPVRMALFLLKDGAQILEVGKWEGPVSYDKPVKQVFQISGKTLDKTSRYSVRLVLSDEKGNAIGTVEKTIPSQESRDNAASTRKEPGLAGGWIFNAGSGTQIEDLSPFGNDAKIIGGKWLRKNGNVIMLNGQSNEYIDCGSGKSLDISGPITIEAWVHSLAEAGNGVQVLSTIVSRGRQYSLNIYFWKWIGYGSINYTYLGESSKNTAQVEWRGNFPRDSVVPRQWNHIVVVNDFALQPRLYLNGVPSPNLHYYNPGIKQTKAVLNPGDKIEKNVGGTTDDHVIIGKGFNGMIASVTIYNFALPEEEVICHYKENVKLYN